MRAEDHPRRFQLLAKRRRHRHRIENRIDRDAARALHARRALSARLDRDAQLGVDAQDLGIDLVQCLGPSSFFTLGAA